LTIPAFLILALFVVGGCRQEAERASSPSDAHGQNGAGAVLALPELAPVELGSAPLQVIATTSIIGDVVAQVGGEAIELTTLMGPGQDPHSYEPTPQEMATVSQAHVVFVNGWNLEEALVHDLEQIAEDVPTVPISAGIEPLAFGEHEQQRQDEDHTDVHTAGAADPHVWFSVPNVEQWVENVERVLAALDPANAETYARNAEAYRVKLEDLQVYVQGQLTGIPAEKRYLVTNHDSLGYLAHEYELTVLGTVLPAASTMAEPSASDLAALVKVMQEHHLCTLFAETTISPKLAETVAAELGGCEAVTVLKLYTGAVGPAGSGADSYIGMFRHNVDTIVAGLQ
jgi:ABC-type Zn uptake system ZnuABC Zn-binding protein ZnuA